MSFVAGVLIVLFCVVVAAAAGVIALFWLVPDGGMRRLRFIERMKRRVSGARDGRS